MLQITLKAARVNAGYTQERAAELLEVAIKTLQNWESGETSPTIEQGKKIAQIYGLSFDNIIF